MNKYIDGKEIFWESFTDIFPIGVIVFIVAWTVPDLRQTCILCILIIFSLCFLTKVVEKAEKNILEKIHEIKEKK